MGYEVVAGFEFAREGGDHGPLAGSGSLHQSINQRALDRVDLSGPGWATRIDLDGTGRIHVVRIWLEFSGFALLSTVWRGFKSQGRFATVRNLRNLLVSFRLCVAA